MLASLTSDYDNFFESTNGFDEASSNSPPFSSAPSSPELRRGRSSMLSSESRWSFLAAPEQISILENHEMSETVSKSNGLSLLQKSKPETAVEKVRRHAASLGEKGCLVAVSEIGPRRTKSESFISERMNNEEITKKRGATMKAMRRISSTNSNSFRRSATVTETSEIELTKAEGWTTNETTSISSSIDTNHKFPDISVLTKRKAELEDMINRCQLQLLESLREEWLITGVIPEGFEEHSSSVIAFNPSLTSFPLAHLLPNNRSECTRMYRGTDFKQASSNGDMEKSTTLRKYTEEAYCGSEPDESDAFSCVASMDSSFSSGPVCDKMTLSMQLLSRKSGCISMERSHCVYSTRQAIRENIEAKICELDQDYKIVEQLYKVHKQRSLETNVAAYKNAYKCNAQKLRDISRAKAELMSQLNQINEANLRATEILMRASSFSNKHQLHTDHQSVDSFSSINDDSGMLTLPRYRPSSLNAEKGTNGSGAHRWGWKRKERPSIKPLVDLQLEDKGDNLVDTKSAEAAPIISRRPHVAWAGSLKRRLSHTTRNSYGTSVPKSRLSLLPMHFLIPRSKNQSKKTEETTLDQHSPITESIYEEAETNDLLAEIEEKLNVSVKLVPCSDTLCSSQSSPGMNKPVSALEETLVLDDQTLASETEDSAKKLDHHTLENNEDEDANNSDTLKRTNNVAYNHPSSAISLSTTRSSSGCYSLTSQTSSTSSSANTASDSANPMDQHPQTNLRKQPTRSYNNNSSSQGLAGYAFEPATNSIRCICSCISEQCGTGVGSIVVGCDCNNMTVAEEASDTATPMTPMSSRNDGNCLPAENKIAGRRSLLTYFRPKLATVRAEDIGVDNHTSILPPPIRRSLWHRARCSLLPLNK